MTDVILIKLEPDREINKFAPPFGILYLANALEKAGYEVRLIHETGTKANIQKLIESIHKEKPIFVGFSTFTSASLIPTKKASIEVKKRCKIPVIWGGIHSTILPEQTLENDFIDIIGIGEGEETIVELTEFLGDKGFSPRGLDNIRGIGFKTNGRVVVNELRPFIENLDAYSPAWHLLDIEKYIYTEEHFYAQIGSKLSGDRTAAIITSRGCPWRCGYCYNHIVNKRTFRAQSVEKVLGEIRHLKQFNVSTLIVEDDNFFGDKTRALEIVRNMNIPWSSTIRADCVANWGRDFIKELGENGCLELRIGVESGSQQVLDIMKKDLTIKQIRTAIELCSQYKIRTLLNFMVGIPGESWPDVCQTLDLMDELSAISQYVAVGSPGIYVPFPGTFLCQEAAKKGYQVPGSLDEWAKDYGQKWKIAPYADKRIKFVGFYSSIIRRDFKNVSFPFFAKLLKRIAIFRWKRRYFRWPIDYYLPAFFIRLLRKIGSKKIAGAIYE